MNNSFWKCLSVLALALVVAGCGTGGPRLYKAGGTVTYNDKPVSDAEVIFQYEDGNSSSGRTDAAGKFTLLYFGNPKGAAAGKCLVSVNKSAALAGSGNPAGTDTNDPAEMMKRMKQVGEETMKSASSGGSYVAPKGELPAKYSDFKSSGLSFEITTDETKNNFDIVLKD